MQPVVSINGHLLSDITTGVSPYDRSFLLGDGVFETLRGSGTTPWYLERHLSRLQQATNRFGLHYPQELPTWIDHAVQGAVSQQTHDYALRITVSRGGVAPQKLAGDDGNTFVAITVSDLPISPRKWYDEGISAQVAHGVRNDRGLLAGFKTTSYAESILALRDANAAGFDDAAFRDTYGFISEATASNLFAVIDGALVTPSVTHGILPGITRAVVIELAKAHNIPSVERELGFAELLDAPEAFLTSSLRGIVPLVRIDNTKLGDGFRGDVTHRIMMAYDNATTRT